MKVLVVSDRNGVSEFFRVGTPYRLLAEAGLIECTQDNGANPALVDHLDQFDVAVFSRPDSWQHSYLLLAAKQAGLRVIVDIDDNLLLVPPSIGIYHAWRRRGTNQITDRLWHYKRNIRLADVLSVSTEALGRQLCAQGLRRSGDYMVLPNMVLESAWQNLPEPDPVKPPGHIWVGWWGIYNHWDDWRDVAPFVQAAIAEREQARLVLLGMPELSHLFPRLVETGQLISGPFVDPSDLAGYRALVTQFDVALAPTADHPFNESKSDLKILQYGIAGVPTIASTTTYRDWHGLATILPWPSSWGEALASALDDLSADRAKGRRLQEYVLARRTYESQVRRWLEPLGLEVEISEDTQWQQQPIAA